MPRDPPKRPPVHPAAPAPGIRPSAWTPKQCPGTCPRRSSLCECPALAQGTWGGVGGSMVSPQLEEGKGHSGKQWEEPHSPSQSVGARHTPGGPQDQRFRYQLGRELCGPAGSAAMAGKQDFTAKNESSAPAMPITPTMCRALDLGGGMGVAYPSIWAPACGVTPRAERLLVRRGREAVGGGVGVRYTHSAPWLEADACH